MAQAPRQRKARRRTEIPCAHAPRDSAKRASHVHELRLVLLRRLRHRVGPDLEIRRSRFQKQGHGRVRLATSQLEVEQTITGRRHAYAVGSMHLGGVDFYCALKPYPGKEEFDEVVASVWSAFRTASLPVMLRILQ